MNKCPKCENIEQFRFQGTYNIYVEHSLEHSSAKLIRELKARNFPFDRHNSGSIACTLSADQLFDFASLLYEVFSDRELADAKMLMIPESAAAQHPAELLPYFLSLRKFSGICQAQSLVELIEQKKLVIWFQPIFAQDNLDDPFAWECLLRAETNGKLLQAGELLAMAKQSDLLFFLDREARISAIKQASEARHLLQKLFINFNPTSIYDPVFCLRTTDQAIAESNYQPADIVFEVTESEFVADRKHLLKIMSYYREKGYQVALDDLGSGYSSLNLLNQLQPNYVKLDMDLIRDIDKSDIKKITLEKIVDLAVKLNIATVAEGIETRAEFDFIKTLPIDYYQGFYFAKPQPKEQIGIPRD